MSQKEPYFGLEMLLLSRLKQSALKIREQKSQARRSRTILLQQAQGELLNLSVKTVVTPQHTASDFYSLCAMSHERQPSFIVV